MAAAQFPLAVAQNSRTIFVILITALLVLHYQVWATSARFLRVVWVQPKTLGKIANDSNKSWLWQKAQGTGSPGQIEARIFSLKCIAYHIAYHIAHQAKRKEMVSPACWAPHCWRPRPSWPSLAIKARSCPAFTDSQYSGRSNQPKTLRPLRCQAGAEQVTRTVVGMSLERSVYGDLFVRLQGTYDILWYIYSRK